MSEKDKNWMTEQKRLEQVLEIIKHQSRILEERKGGLKDRVIDIRKNFWEDVTVNLDEIDDIIETQASLKQQAEFLGERERSHGQLSDQLKTLDRLKDSPYFGRIDFQAEDEDAPEQIYLGIASLMDENEEDFLIYDWRAPISSLYYDFPPGPAEYETAEEKVSGEMTLKRQYIIRNGQLKGMFDTGLTIGDHLLQAVLGGNATNQMKSIVATIQQEQNQIIRNEKSKLLIVQGVAGSGKTSAALQRVAYLLYKYRETLSSENMILFSPNPLFNSYVATVLPELGEENMKQTTFYEYLKTRLGRRFLIETPFEQMEYYLNAEQDRDYRARVTGMQWKGSLRFKNLIDNFLETLRTEGLEFRNIVFRGKAVVTNSEIASYFYSLDKAMSISNKMEGVSKWLLKKVKDYARNELSKDWVLQESELLEKEEYHDVYHKMQEEDAASDDPFFDFVREEELLRKRVIKENFQPLIRKIKRMSFVHVKNTYRKLYESQSVESGSASLPDGWEDICRVSIDMLDDNKLTWEEAAPFLYFQNKLIGFQVNRTIRHVFIDEAQDYSPFQFAFFKEIFPYSRMTLLGDINQAIYAHALEDGTLLSEDIEDRHERITLMRSYRSTRQIVEFTKAFMPGGEKIIPFNRDGNKPAVKETNNKQELHDLLLEQIEAYRYKGYKNVAVICKTMAESDDAFDFLEGKVDAALIDQETFTFQEGLVVIPAYLAKGIEFDAVIIYDGSQSAYNDELERNLFYTACTRAMHELTVLSLGERNDFINQAGNDKYILL